MIHRPEQIPLKTGDIAYLHSRGDYDGLRRGSKVEVMYVEPGILSGVDNYYATVKDVETGKRYTGYWWRFRPEILTEEEYSEWLRTT